MARAKVAPVEAAPVKVILVKEAPVKVNLVDDVSSNDLFVPCQLVLFLHQNACSQLSQIKLRSLELIKLRSLELMPCMACLSMAEIT